MDTPLSQLPWRERLYVVIFFTNTAAGRRFDSALLLVILASLLVVMLDSVASINHSHGPLLGVLEWGFTALFAVSYLIFYCAIIRFRVPRWFVAKPLDASRTVRRPAAFRAGAAGAGTPASAFPVAASACAQTRTAAALPGTVVPAAHPPQ